MNTKNVRRTVALALGISALSASPLLADVGVTVTVPVPVPPPVVVTPAAPSVEVGVPDNYVWDGTEYVGTIGSGYYYLSGDVWLPLDTPRLTRWHAYEHDHADWRTHAIRNE